MDTTKGTTGTIIMVDTAHQLKQAMHTGRRGLRIIYHTGFLLWDRSYYNKKLAHEDRVALQRLANEALKASNDKKVFLFQRRLSHPFGFEYLAVLR